MLESLKKANAKRQAEYRKRHLKEGSDQRLNVILGLAAKLALERMAKLHGVSNKELLERVLLETQSQLIADMDGEQQARYYANPVSSITNHTAIAELEVGKDKRFATVDALMADLRADD